MEKLKSIVSILSSLIFLMLLVLIFSCGEKKTVTVVEDKNGDTIKTTTTETQTDTYYNKFKDESRDLEIKLKELGDKAKQKGGEIGHSIKEKTNKLEGERKGFHSDSAGSNKSNTSEEWKVFKEKTRGAIDSLEKKLNDH